MYVHIILAYVHYIMYMYVYVQYHFICVYTILKQDASNLALEVWTLQSYLEPVLYVHVHVYTLYNLTLLTQIEFELHKHRLDKESKDLMHLDVLG